MKKIFFILFAFLLFGITFNNVVFATSSLTDGLKGYWKLDGTGGVLAYDEINQTYDTLTGAFFTDGKINNGMSCGTTAQNYYMTIPKATKNYDFIHKTGNFTISIWINPFIILAQQIVMANIASSGSQYGFYFLLQADATIRFLVSNGTLAGYPIFIESLTIINEQTWNNIVITGNGQVVSMYVNGDYDKMSYIGTLSNNSATYNLIVGSITTATNYYFGGKIDEIGIWDRYLNETEVQELYNGGVGLQYPFITSEIEPEPEPINIFFADISQIIITFISIFVVLFLLIFSEIINSPWVRMISAIGLMAISFLFNSYNHLITLILFCIGILLMVRAFLWK